jgi:predicted transcriptional regulator
MRTTITLDDDVAARLKAESRRSDRTFREVVNEAIRLGLARRSSGERKPFKVVARDLGLRDGVALDNIGALLEQIEGPRHR